MSQKRWRFTVSELGSATAIHDLTVEASDWVTALTRARAQIGERGGVPPGAMCNVTADGKVMLMDGVGRKQYRLEPTTAASVKPPGASAASPPAPVVPAPVVPGPAAKRAPRPTMAYTSPGAVASPVPAVGMNQPAQTPTQPLPQAMQAVVPPVQAAPSPVQAVPSPLQAALPPVQAALPPVQAAPSAPAVSVPVPVPQPEKSNVKASRPRAPTVAFAASDTVRETLPEPATEEVALRAQRPDDTVSEEIPPSTMMPLDSVALPVANGSDMFALAGAKKLYERDAEPTKESPLLYRERHYFVPDAVSNDEARTILLQLFEETRASIASRAKGKLVKMAVFDHDWVGQPQRAPFLSLQWKDWRGEPEIVEGNRALSAEAAGRAQAELEMQARMEEQARLIEAEDRRVAEERRIAELQAQARADEERLVAEEQALREARERAAQEAAQAHAAAQAQAAAEAERSLAAQAAAVSALAASQAVAEAERLQAAQVAAQAAAQAAALASAKPVAVGGWQPATAPSVPPPAQPVAQPVAATPQAPVVASAPSSQSQVQSKLGTPRPTPSNLGDDRLADAFEGLQDLAFLHTPLEAAEFVVRLLGELIPCEAVSVALYDINAHELRFVASSGVGAAERKGDAVPTNVGILGRALMSYVRPTRVNDVPADKAFDPGVDGRVGLEVHTLLAKPLAAGDRLLGAVQLLNRRNDFEFSFADENLLVYVADRLSDFLEKAKARGNPKRSVAR